MQTSQKTLIIGGVAGGMAAATRLRRLDENAEIVVFEAGPYVSFANCGLPYYVGGVITDRDKLISHSPETFNDRFQIDVKLHHEATAIDAAAKTVTVHDHSSGKDSTHGYDTLIIAAGATANLPAAVASPRTHTLRTIDDMDRIHAILDEPGTSSVVIVGGGFIGLEAAENIRHRGFATTVIQRGAQVFPTLDPEMVAPLAAELAEHGVTIHTGTQVRSVDNDIVTLIDGTRIQADLIIDSTGVAPSVTVAASAGLRIGESGGVWVDVRHRTTDPSIYAVGDVAEKTDLISGTATLVALAGLANRHGRAVADAIAGTAEDTVPALGTSIIGVFGVTAASTGWTETRLVASGRPHRVIHVHPASHATYYPGGSPLAIKLLVDPATDLILGAQVVGRDGVDKRIDVLAVAISAGITASQLKNLELAYAPQYASAKDPVNIAGYVAENTASGLVPTVQWHEVDALAEAGATILDVRTAAEFERGQIPGAINVPLDEIRDRVAEIPPGNVIVHCQVGQRGNTATRILTQSGHSVTNLDGGYLTWAAGTTTTGRLR
ncbi:FAD-dependent oxidoreductase [Salinibacterium sp. G-O1]|uniref:FAD-dependent oxidoreductase n=1 Tax=Salinibacterium sp. G-O1 TaxID=3046208 RepID=UPI0024B90D7C|nr:FAD-dependent oxidoreductase [Salinibacterium sp. G-O1]MDJ0335493.1 FAD-dependent oxidoreductase [Salinibacterium sp. G-O1]